MLFFISGITGQVGGAAARALLKEGHELRALVRDPAKAASWAEQGVTLIEGGFTDSDAIASVLQGVDGAFLMIPPQHAPDANWTEAKAICASYQAALKKHAPGRVVVLSSIGSEQPKGLGFITATHLLEQALSDLPFPTAFIRAGSFLENYAYTLGAANASGFFDTFFTPTSKRVPMIASADIGNEVARRLTAPAWTGKAVIELGTPASPDDIAAVLTEVLGKEVKARSIPREAWTAVLEKMGFGAAGIAGFSEMEDGFNSNWIAFGRPGTEAVAATITPREFLTQAHRRQ